MLRSLGLLVLLYAFWVLLSGFFTPFLLSAGLGCALAVVLFAHRMKVIDEEGHPLAVGWRALCFYWPWLLKEIVKSAWDVSRRILDPRLPISPVLVRFKPSQSNELGLVIHANSITLTPGTISVLVEREEFLVHALSREGGAGLADSEMDRRVAALTRET